MNRELLNQELSKIEKPAGIANPKDFRNEVVKFALRARANNGGKNPSWTSYEKIREVIERRMFSQVEDLLPVISFGSKKDSETEKKHEEFVERMVERGYTAAPGAPPGRMVHAGEEGRLTGPDRNRRLPMHIVDRRLNPERQEPRQPAALHAARAKALIREAVREALGQRAASRTPTQASEVAIPAQGVHEPSLPPQPPAAACATIVLPGNKEFVAGRHDPAPAGRRRRRRLARAARTARARTISPSRCRRTSSSICSSKIWSCRISSSAELKDAESAAAGSAPATRSRGSPANLNAACAPCATAWRGASRCSGRSPHEIEALRERDRRAAEAETTPTQRPRAARGARAQAAAHRR